MASKKNSEISFLRQAKLLDISRSSIYYEPVVNNYDIKIMNAIDEIYTECPFYGYRRIKPELEETYHLEVGKKKIISLMKQMGVEAIYPKKKVNLSIPDDSHKKFPYLLKKLKIVKPNQVWGTDITYIRIKNGFAYLMALMDWFSRYVVAWKLSSTLENKFCVQALKKGLDLHIPKIHNSDQGCQFTSMAYVEILEDAKVKISMDGRGRCMDNIFTERLWRSVKYENVYLNDYADFNEANDGLKNYLKFYNEKRRHQSLDYKTPAQIYFKK
ncbi:MAG: IS3 family transposase [bacterium]